MSTIARSHLYLLEFFETSNFMFEYTECIWIAVLCRYGYRGKDCRSNIFVLPSGELLYFIAAVAIMYNPESGTQRHFTEHNDDIKW